MPKVIRFSYNRPRLIRSPKSYCSKCVRRVYYISRRCNRIDPNTCSDIWSIIPCIHCKLFSVEFGIISLPEQGFFKGILESPCSSLMRCVHLFSSVYPEQLCFESKPILGLYVLSFNLCCPFEIPLLWCWISFR